MGGWYLLQHSCELGVVVVLEVEPVGEVEEGRGRGQQEQKRRGVHSASGGCTLEAREASTSARRGGGGGGVGRGGGGATGDDVSMGPQNPHICNTK